MRALWPHSDLYDKQRDIVMSVRESKETYVTAGNQLGKDYVVGAICLAFFVCPKAFFSAAYVRQIEAQRKPGGASPHTRRVVTTSVKDDHIDVLWAEVGRFYRTCRWNLDDHYVMTTHEIRTRAEVEAKNPLNYLKGMVSAKGEGLAGHHAAYTLMVGDESSGIDDEVYKMGQGWAKRQLYFGNPNECQNFFRRGVKAGDLAA